MFSAVKGWISPSQLVDYQHLQRQDLNFAMANIDYFVSSQQIIEPLATDFGNLQPDIFDEYLNTPHIA